MKKLFSLLSLSIFATCLYAQAPLFTKQIISEVYPRLTGEKLAASDVELYGALNGKLVYKAKIYKKDNNGYLKPFTVLMAGNEELSVGTFAKIICWRTMNNELYFVKTDTLNSQPLLWKTDGTAAGTKPVSGNSPTVNDIKGQHGSIVYNNKLYYMANDSVHGYEMWATDGTAQGTSMVFDLLPGIQDAFPVILTVYNGKLYFYMQEKYVGIHIYAYDDNTGNVEHVKLLEKNNGGPSYATVINNKFCFVFADTSGAEPWVCDGTEAGTFRLNDINAGKDFSCVMTYEQDSFFTSYNGKLYFTGYSYQPGMGGLWETDGTIAGTVRLSAVYSDASKSIFNGKMYMLGVNTAGGVVSDSGLWVSDGTAQGTKLVKKLNTGYINDGAPDRCFATYMGSLYYIQEDEKKVKQLWHTDGTEAGTQIVVPPSNKFTALNDTRYLSVFENGIYFPANYDSSAGQLWSFRGFPSAVDNVKNKENTFSLYPNPASSYCTIKTQQAYNKGSVTVYDVAGRMILRKNITGDTNNISLKGMPKGVYTVSITLDDRTAAQQLVVE